MEKTCKICGAQFVPTSNNQKCCSSGCREQNRREYERIYKRDYNPRPKKHKPDSISEKLARYGKLGLSYGYGMAMDHPEWGRVII